MAAKFGVDLLGKLPLDNQLMAACEQGQAFVTAYPDSVACAPLKTIVANLKARVEANAGGGAQEGELLL